MKTIIKKFACFILMLTLTSCNNVNDIDTLNIKMPHELSIDTVIKNVKPVNQTKEKLKVAIALSTGGKGDKSFNDAAIKGLDKAVQKLGVEYYYDKGNTTEEDKALLEKYALDDNDLIIAVGFLLSEPLSYVASKYPDKKFIIVDYVYEQIPKNVICVAFSEQDGSFLSGVLASGISTTNKVGFVGGMDSPLIKKFEAGFTQGAKTYKPDINVISKYVGTTPDAFNNPAEAEKISNDFIAQGVDVIYHASGGSGSGVISAAKNAGIKVIGVDSNQNWVAPGVVVSNMEKKVDIAVYDIINKLANGSFNGGNVQVFGLKENGVGLTDLNSLTLEETDGVSEQNRNIMKNMKDNIPAQVKSDIEQFKKKIVNGEIVVSSTFE